MEKRASKVVLVKLRSGNVPAFEDDEYFYINDDEDYLTCHICSCQIVDDTHYAYDLGPNQAVCSRCADAQDEEE